MFVFERVLSESARIGLSYAGIFLSGLPVCHMIYMIITIMATGHVVKLASFLSVHILLSLIFVFCVDNCSSNFYPFNKINSKKNKPSQK